MVPSTGNIIMIMYMIAYMSIGALSLRISFSVSTSSMSKKDIYR